jgi:outer membrane protein assembly factor BamB
MPKLSHLVAGLLLAGSTAAFAADWSQWRGPEQTGVSRERGLPEKWDPETGENVLWTAPAGGMSSPIVMNGKVYTWTRTGEVPSGDGGSATMLAGPATQEVLVCLDKTTGKQVWEHRENMTQTDVPFHRLGWGNVVGDPKTGRVYGYGTQGRMLCLDGQTGKLIWSRHMTEEFGVISTFGGRTPSPAIDGDQIFLAMVSFGWGDQSQGQHRIFALDKETGELNWSAGTGGRPVDAPYNTPVIANINGVRQVMFAAGDGGVHSFQARTGKHMWSFAASKRGLNASVVVEGQRVFAVHSEENIDTSTMGRVVCLDVSGEKPKEVWRVDGIEAGFATPTIGNGQFYVMDNGGMLHALDVSTGASQWKKRVDRIGKASLVLADGKLYVPGANGNFMILKPGAKKADVLSKVEVTGKLGREYEIFGSVAVSDGKIYLQAANKMYCIGDKSAPATGSADAIPPAPEEDAAGSEPAWVQVVPADVVLRPGEKTTFSIRTFDDKGHPVTVSATPKWNIDQLTMPPPPSAPAGTPPTKAGNLKGEVNAGGVFTAGEGPFQGGAVTALIEVNGKQVQGHARVRVLPNLPWTIDFKNAAMGRPPLTWIGAGGKFAVRETDGAPALLKLSDFDLYHAARTYFGSREMSNYTVEADIKVGEKMLGESRQMPDAGVINSKYALVLLGNHQRCQINVWSGALPTEKSWSGSLNATASYKWEPNTWYRFKLRVDAGESSTAVKGKVWKKGDAEPEAWTVQLEDKLANRHGSPGLFAESLVTPAKSDVFYNNIVVTPNK